MLNKDVIITEELNIKDILLVSQNGVREQIL